MPPNSFVAPPFDPEAMRQEVKKDRVPFEAPAEDNYKLQIFQSSMNLLAHILVGATVSISLLFAFRSWPMNITQGHIVICVLGYQLLMAQAILSLSSDNGWSSRLKFVDKRRAHWILQILGSGMAIGGSFYKILDKNVHWNTLHGQFALVALVFTTVSFVNGLTSLWAYELRGVISGNISKLTHICFGTVAFAASGISLIYGFQKGMFINWSSQGMADAVTAIVAVMTFLVIINPLITFYSKSKTVIKNRSL